MKDIDHQFESSHWPAVLQLGEETVIQRVQGVPEEVEESSGVGQVLGRAVSGGGAPGAGLVLDSDMTFNYTLTIPFG